jgi:hypothetical protein
MHGDKEPEAPQGLKLLSTVRVAGDRNRVCLPATPQRSLDQDFALPGGRSCRAGMLTRPSQRRRICRTAPTYRINSLDPTLSLVRRLREWDRVRFFQCSTYHPGQVQKLLPFGFAQGRLSTSCASRRSLRMTSAFYVGLVELTCCVVLVCLYREGGPWRVRLLHLV